MFKTTILAGSKRDVLFVDGGKTPREIISEFGANPNSIMYRLNEITLNMNLMDTTLNELRGIYNFGEEIFLYGVVKTENA